MLFAHRNCGCPVTGSVQDQLGWSFELPYLVGSALAYCYGLDYITCKRSYNHKIGFERDP